MNEIPERPTTDPVEPISVSILKSFLEKIKTNDRSKKPSESVKELQGKASYLDQIPADMLDFVIDFVQVRIDKVSRLEKNRYELEKLKTRTNEKPVRVMSYNKDANREYTSYDIKHTLPTADELRKIITEQNKIDYRIAILTSEAFEIIEMLEPRENRLES